MRFLRSVLALSAFTLIAPASHAASDKMLRYEDNPPRVSKLVVRPVKGTTRAGDAAPAHAVLGVSRSGDVLLLLGGDSLRVYDPLSHDFDVLRLTGAPDELSDATARAFSFGGDDNLHVLYQIGTDREPGYRIATFDPKGRFVRRVPIKLLGPLEASLAVSPSGEFYVSSLTVLLKSPHPPSPVFVFQKDGTYKGGLGEWEESSKDPIEEGLRNLRWIRIDPRGRVYLIRRDRLQVESYTVDGSFMRGFSVKVKGGASYYADDAPAAAAPSRRLGDAGTDGTARLSGGVFVPTPPPLPSPKTAPESDPSRQKAEKMLKGGTFSRVDVADVTRDIALHKNRIYVLRSAFVGSKDHSRHPVIDVFDSLGKWQEQLELEPRENFSALTIDKEGRIYLFTLTGEHTLFEGDLESNDEGAPHPGGASTK